MKDRNISERFVLIHYTSSIANFIDSSNEGSSLQKKDILEWSLRKEVEPNTTNNLLNLHEKVFIAINTVFTKVCTKVTIEQKKSANKDL